MTIAFYSLFCFLSTHFFCPNFSFLFILILQFTSYVFWIEYLLIYQHCLDINHLILKFQPPLLVRVQNSTCWSEILKITQVQWRSPFWLKNNFVTWNLRFNFNQKLVWSFGLNWVIHLYLKTLNNSACLIFWDRFWFLNIPFVSMVIHHYLALFWVDHLSHPVMSAPVFLLYQFIAFVYYMIKCFISLPAQHTLTILLHIIDFMAHFNFHVISPYGINLYCYKQRFSFSL